MLFQFKVCLNRMSTDTVYRPNSPHTQEVCKWIKSITITAGWQHFSCIKKSTGCYIKYFPYECMYVGYVCMHVCMYMYACMYACICVCVCIYIYANPYLYDLLLLYSWACVLYVCLYFYEYLYLFYIFTCNFIFFYVLSALIQS